MIKLYDLTPGVYYEHSRDFQLIGRLYDLVLNSVKTNTDMIYSLPLSEDSDEKLLDLMSMTFGFKSKHEYNIQQLKSLCACFAKVIRNKGNRQSIQDACNALVCSEGIREQVYIDIDEETAGLIIYVPQELSDVNLLNDLLVYILPAGMTCKIIKTLKTEVFASTEVTVEDNVRYSKNPKSGISTSLVISKIENADSKITENRPFDEVGAFANTTVVAKYEPDF